MFSGVACLFAIGGRDRVWGAREVGFGKVEQGVLICGGLGEVASSEGRRYGGPGKEGLCCRSKLGGGR